MWSEAEIRDAARNWRAVADAAAGGVLGDDPYQKALSEGYAGALEMVLRPSRDTAPPAPIVPPYAARRARVGVVFGRAIARAEASGDHVHAQLLTELRDEVLVAIDVDPEGGEASRH